MNNLDAAKNHLDDTTLRTGSSTRYHLQRASNAGEESSQEKRSRKRQRPSLFFSLSIVPTSSTASSNSKNSSNLIKELSPKNGHPDRPDWAHLTHLLSALLLTSGLGVVSAMDAKNQCLEHETYSLMELMDDDAYNRYEQAAEFAALQQHRCVTLFLKVVVPAGVTTSVLSLCGLILLFCQSKQWAGLYVAKDDFPKILRNLVILFWMLVVVVALQTYNVAWIMLIPKNMSQEDNPYQSLAAVDRYGNVGDNANLYYLTWISEGLALALLYQVGTACFRAYRRAHMQRLAGAPHVMDETSLLRTTSWEADYSPSPRTLTSWWRERRRQQKYAWYDSIYRLRFRTGIWAAAFLASWVIVASSQYVASQVLWPTVSDDMELFAWGDVSMRLRVCELIGQQENNKLPPQYCGRTMAAWLAGIASMVLCASAIIMHATARYCAKRNQKRPFLAGMNDEVGDERDGDGAGIWSTAMVYDKSAMTAWERVVAHHQRNRRLPLHTEIFLSVVLSILTGFNAVFVTGVQGPGSTVGNLYYASWLTYLLCVRIALGCLEEYYNLSEDPDDHSQNDPMATQPSKSGQKDDSDSTSDNIKRPTYQAPSITNDNSRKEEQAQKQEIDRNFHLRDSHVEKRSFTVETTGSSGSTTSQDNQFEKTRVDRVRRYFFLGIFSIACAASAYDAASNSGEDLSKQQLYMILAPCFVSLQSVILFALSLSKRCYQCVSKFPVGGVCSVVAFGLWLGNLILTMHSSDSWAVNRIGEIKMANLYYFSWASILTAGVQMSSYFKDLLRPQKYDIMSIVWAAIVKVCFVILGAALHIWHTISGNCGFDEITSGASSFCSRTVLAIMIALTGMLVGGLVVVGRMLCMTCPDRRCNRLQAHVEMLISLFLVLLFGVAVALITGIGGPGQTVGDLYYSTWLAFLVSFMVFVSCYGELNAAEHRERSTSISKSALNDGTSALV